MDLRFWILDLRLGRAARSRAQVALQSKIQNSKSKISAFTLTELLVVISLVVLILALAVPAFNLISGSGSIDQAQNQISAMFAQAQATAVDRQNYVGVLFYKDAPADRYTLVIVEKVKPAPWVPLRPRADGTFVGVEYRKGDVVSRVTTITTTVTA